MVMLRTVADNAPRAEEDSRRRLGLGLTAEELVRVLRRYPGDIGADMTRRFRF
jgi:hypothetical protein